MKKNKHAQSELITTVLLILVSIAAVVLVSTFVLNMVRQNLQGTECFQTAGQLTINLDERYTYFDSTNKKVYISISRAEKDFNLTGILASVGTESAMSSFTIKNNVSNIKMFDGSDNIIFPKAGGTQTYAIDVTGELDSVTKVKVVPIIAPSNKACSEGSDEKDIPARA